MASLNESLTVFNTTTSINNATTTATATLPIRTLPDTTNTSSFTAETIISTSTNLPAYCDLSDPDQCEKIRVLKTVVLSTTITIVIVTLACIVILQKYKTFSQRIVCHILVANLLAAITVVAGDGRPTIPVTPGCVAQGFFQFLFDWAEFLWMCYLTFFLFFIMVKDKDTGLSEWLYTTTGWVLPLSLACLPLTTNDYGPAGAPYCWLTNTPAGQGWRFGLYWGPVIVGMIFMLVAIVYIFWHVRRRRQCTGQPDVNQANQVDEYLKPLIGYAISFLCINLVMAINRVQNAFAPPIFGLLCFHVFLVSSYGTVLSTLFFFTNGRKEFTYAKFQRGFTYHIAKIKRLRQPASSDRVSQFSTSPATTPVPPVKTFHVAGAITEYVMDYDTVSLDSA